MIPTTHIRRQGISNSMAGDMYISTKNLMKVLTLHYKNEWVCGAYTCIEIYAALYIGLINIANLPCLIEVMNHSSKP